MESNSSLKDIHDTKNHYLKNQSNFYQDPDHDHDTGTENIDTSPNEKNCQLKYENQDQDLISDLMVNSIPSSDFDYYSLIEKVSKEGVNTNLDPSLNLNPNMNGIDWRILKKALKKEIVLKSNQMFEKYGGLDQFDYLPYNCRLHSEIESSQRKKDSPTCMIGEYSCQDCEKSILENFLEDIFEAIDCHTDFPPTIQRICELLLFPDCYNNTKSFLYALDKVSLINSLLFQIFTGHLIYYNLTYYVDFTFL